MINASYYLIAFDSTHAAMAADAYFREKNAPAKLIPLPSVISAGCGFAIKVKLADAETIESLLTDVIFERATFYQITKTNGETGVMPWKIS